MHHASSAYERSDEAHHEINGVIRGKNAQIAHARPKGIPGRERAALLQIIFVGEDAALGPPARSRGIDDAGDVVLLPHDEVGSAFALEVFPAKRARQLHAQRGLRHQNDLGRDVVEVGRLHDRPPQVVLDDQHLGLGMREQLQMFGRGQLVVERHQHAAAVKDRIGRNQPLRLIRHDDGGAVAGIVIGVLQSAGQRQRNLFEIGIRQADFFAIALRFDQADFGGKAVERIAQRGAQTRVLAEIEHKELLIS